MDSYSYGWKIIWYIIPLQLENNMIYHKLLLLMIVFNYHIIFFLVNSFKKSQIGLDSTEPAFDQLTKSCLQRNLPVWAWRSSEHLAMEQRGEHLRIFDVKHKKAPTLAEITLTLTNTKDNSNCTANIVDWIADGINCLNWKCKTNTTEAAVYYGLNWYIKLSCHIISC